MTDHTYLVLGATGRQGRAVVRALASRGEAVATIVASSRSPESASSKALLDIDRVSRVVKADYNKPASVVAAVKESGATRVWFTTDFWSIPWHRRTGAEEARLGRNVIDAIIEAKQGGQNIEHVVYSSVGDADKAPEDIGHFRGKADVEKHMASRLGGAGVTWSVIRPVAFFENFDDPGNFNPLTKGKLKFLSRPTLMIKYIACEDIGKGSAALLTSPGDYAGKIVEAAGAEHTGLEAVDALTEASGTECKYELAMPRFALKLMSGDLFRMITWMEDVGYSANINDFKEIVPDALDAKGFFGKVGQWANGEKFTSS